MSNKTKLIKQALEDFFYKIRINIALRDVLSSPEHDAISKMFSSAIKKQFLMFSKKEVISDIVGLTKADLKPVDNPEIYDGVMRHWIALVAIIEEDELNSYLLFAANKGGQSALDKLKVEQTFNLVNETSINKLRQRVDNSLALIEQTSQLWLVKIIRDSLKEGLSPEDIAKLVKSSLKKASDNRGDLIAEHEAALALGDIELEVYARSGIEYVKWVTARDELVCDICMGNEDAGSIKIGSLFPSGVKSTPAHHRCRCLILPVNEGEIANIWIGN